MNDYGMGGKSMEDKKELRIVDSKVHSLSEIFSASYTVDFYQREYVWQKKQIEDLISDLTIEFLKNWKPKHDTTAWAKLSFL